MTLHQELLQCRGAMDSRFTLKGTTPQYAPDRAFDTEHIRLEVEVDLARKRLSGVCTTTLRALEVGAKAMEFDAVNFRIRGVRVNGRKARHSYDRSRLTVVGPGPAPAGTRWTVEISYEVRQPKLGLYFIGPDPSDRKKPLQAWTQGEDEYARYWFPCHDAPQDRTTTEIIARVPRGFTAVSNGRLIKKSQAGRQSLFHWKQDIPHATYLVTLAVGQFVEIKDSWRGVPVTYYCAPGQEADARRAFGKTPRMMEFFSRKIGVPYPYAKYAQVAALDFIFGGMENTSATTQTALTLHDERAHLDFSSDPLVAHELAHQWFGDLLTCRHWSQAWLNESFATYFEALFTEYDKGQDEFQWEMHQNAESYFEEDKDHYRRPLVTHVYKQPSDLFDRHLYEKGSWVLHMLRSLLGDEGFWRSIHTYVADNREKVVDSQDLLEAVQKATGRNLAKFFDQWVFKAGHPELKVRAWWDARKKKMFVRVVQTHGVNGENGLFTWPITLAFYTSRGVRRFDKGIDKKTHLFECPLAEEPRLVLVDPEHTLLKKMDFPKSESQWLCQLTEDPHVLGRVEAAQILGRSGGPKVAAALLKALPREKFWAVQGEITKALVRLRSPEAAEALLKADGLLTHPKARRLYLAALGDWPDARFGSILARSAGEEKSYFAEAAAVKSLARGGHRDATSRMERALKTTSWNDVLRSAGVEALASLQPDNMFQRLSELAGPAHSSSVRLSAIRALGGLGARHPQVQERLEQLTKDPFLLVQIAAVRALGPVADERSVPVLETFTRGHWEGRLKRTAEESIAKIKKGIEEEK